MKTFENKKFLKIMVLTIVALFIGIAFYPAVNTTNIDVRKNNTEEDINIVHAADGKTEYWAIIGACARYDDPGASLPITFAQQRFLYWSLLASPNWNANNIICLINDFTDINQPLKYSGGATRENLLEALDEMALNVDEDDVFLFAWMGHGSQVPDDDGDEKTFLRPFDKYDEVICPYDCKRDDNGVLVNFIRDDTLEEKFDNIQAKGQCLIFESCFSGGLVDMAVTSDGGLNSDGDDFIDSEEADAFTEDFKEDIKGLEVIGVDGPGRVVLMASLDNCVARITFGFGGPLTTAMALAFLGAFKGSKKDTNNDNFISVEEAFKWAQPRAIGMVSSYYLGIWLYMISTSYFLSEDSEHQLLDAVINGTKLFFLEVVYIQINLRLQSQSWAFSFPHMDDKYQGLGGLNIVQLDKSKEENVLSTLTLPKEIYTRQPTEQDWNNIYNYIKTETPLGEWSEEDLLNWMPPLDEFLQVSWDDIHPDYQPGFFAEIEDGYKVKKGQKVDFSASILGGESPYTIEWDFGDGATGEGLNPTHVYNEKGSYTVTLKVTDENGDIANDIYNPNNIPKKTVTVTGATSKETVSPFFLRLCRIFPFLQNLFLIKE